MAAITASLVAVAKPAVAAKPARSQRVQFVSNGSRTRMMQVWTPINNKMFETFSFLPPLTDNQIAAQVDNIVENGWVPCLEFADKDQAYSSNENVVRLHNVSPLYYDNRYWTMWKLPMFGCTDGQQVLREVANCRRAFPDAYIRLVAFDNVRQVQCAGFLVNRPAAVRDYQDVSTRSV